MARGVGWGVGWRRLGGGYGVEAAREGSRSLREGENSGKAMRREFDRAMRREFWQGVGVELD